MQLKGSCHCGQIEFTLQSDHPYPYNLCYCSICRKTAGGGGYAINLGGKHHSLNIAGKQHVQSYHVVIRNSESGENKPSPAQRNFCRHCGTALWVWDPRWPELIHPFASAIDTDLPIPPEHTHLMLDSKAPWVTPHLGPEDKQFPAYPDESILQWHERLNLDNIGD